MAIFDLMHRPQRGISRFGGTAASFVLAGSLAASPVYQQPVPEPQSPGSASSTQVVTAAGTAGDSGLVLASASSLVPVPMANQAPEPTPTFEAPTVSHPYRQRDDYASIGVGAYSSNHGYPYDDFQHVEFGLHKGRATWVLGLSRVQRFGLIDSGADSYLYYGWGDGYWGYLYGAYDPNSQFLPRTAYGAELDRQIGNFSWSLAFRRMNFTQDAVNMYFPGITLYFPYHLSVTARWYYVPLSGGQSISIMPMYEDSRHNRVYLNVAAGEIAERPGAFQDFQKYSGYSVAAGVERRLDPRWSVGADALYQHRSGLYDRHGIDLYLKTWW